MAKFYNLEGIDIIMYFIKKQNKEINGEENLKYISRKEAINISNQILIKAEEERNNEC
jgi:hypothetical protein